MPRDHSFDAPRPRNRKIEAELQRALADIIARELKDPRVGNVTISAVDLAPDKRMARVFFTPFASAHPVEAAELTGLINQAVARDRGDGES